MRRNRILVRRKQIPNSGITSIFEYAMIPSFSPKSEPCYGSCRTGYDLASRVPSRKGRTSSALRLRASKASRSSKSRGSSIRNHQSACMRCRVTNNLRPRPKRAYFTMPASDFSASPRVCSLPGVGVQFRLAQPHGNKARTAVWVD